MCAINSHSYTHLILALGIVREPTVWGFITSKYSCTRDIGWATKGDVTHSAGGTLSGGPINLHVFVCNAIYKRNLSIIFTKALDTKDCIQSFLSAY